MLVLVVREQDREPELMRLTGETSRDDNVGITLVDGRLESFDVYPAGFCRPERAWRSWLWSSSAGATVEQEGSRFTARQRSNVGAGGERVEWVALMTGELHDSGSSARGTIHANWSFGAGRGYDAGACQGRVRFSARKKP